MVGQNQVRHMYVAKTAAALTTTGAVKAGTPGDLALLDSQGAAPGAGDDLLFLGLNSASDLITSDIIKNGQFLYAKTVSYSAPVLGVATISALTIDVNTLYGVRINLRGKGSMSVEDEYIKQSFYNCVAGNDQEAIVDGLIAALNRDFSREPGSTATNNDSFSFLKGYASQTLQVTTAPSVNGDAILTVNGKDYVVALLAADTAAQAAAKIDVVLDTIDGVASANVTDTNTITSLHSISFAAGATGDTVTATVGVAAGATLVIAEKSDWVDKSFDPDRMTRLSLDFKVTVSFTTQPTIGELATEIGTGSGKQVQIMEHYLRGERGDAYRGAGYPHNFKAITLEADKALNYDLLEIGYYDEGQYEAKKSKKQITLAFPTGARTASNVLVNTLETASGLTIADFA
jgi:hypothetical protein